jgi:glucokinase
MASASCVEGSDKKRYVGGVDRTLAVDIGGTKIAAGLVDVAGSVIAHSRVLTPRDRDGEGVWEAVLACINNIRGPFSRVGVGCPGPMTSGGELVSPLNIPGWRSFPLRERLTRTLGAPVRIDNDAKTTTLGEVWTGSLQDSRSAMCVVVSTGVGSGIVLDGRLLQGAGGNAGHIGHVIVNPRGRKCACGARGCLEAEIAGPALEAKAGHEPPFDDWLLIEAGTFLGRAIASAAAVLDVESVALAGGVVFGGGLALTASAQAEVDRSFRVFGRSLRLVLARSHPLVGAAALALHWGGCISSRAGREARARRC